MAKKEKTSKNFDKKRLMEYSLPSLIALSIFVLAMIVKGVFPFGKNSFGYLDFNEGLVPSYTALWDILHGNSNIWVSWELGAGAPMYSSIIINSFLSPISWLVAIFPRNAIIYSINLVVIVMFALMAFTAYYCFKKYFPNVSQYVLLLFSLIWTFSGWTLIHYTNVGWLNIMILLPLLLVSAKQLVEEKKILWFVIILSYMLLLTYYITYMVLVGTVIVATTYIIMLAKEKKKIAALLFYAIIISILISIVCFIPSCVTSLQGHRFSGTSAGSPRSELFDHFLSKLSVLIVYPLPVVFFVKLIATYKKDKKNVLFFIITFAIVSIGLIIEPINQMWHTGSYFSFPLRYGFVIIMLMIFGSLYYIEKYHSLNSEDLNKEQKTSSFKLELLLMVFISLSIIGIVVFSVNGSSIIPYQRNNLFSFVIYLMPFIFVYVAIEICLRIKREKVSLGKIPGGIIIFSLCLIQIIGGMIGYCGDVENSRVNRVLNSFRMETSDFEHGYKIKDNENMYNYNYPLLPDCASLNTWIHISSEEQFVGYDKLGYGTISTTLSSQGGTIISDILLGNKYVVSQYILDDRYYTKIDTIDYFDNNDKKELLYLYELNFDMQHVFTTNVDFSNILEDSDNWFENHNLLYKNIYGQTEDILTSVSYEVELIKDKQYKIVINAPEDYNLYMQNKTKTWTNITHDGYSYEAYNGLVNLGITKDVNELIVEAEDDCSIEDIKNNIKFSCMDIVKFKEVHDNYQLTTSNLKLNGNIIDITLNNDKNHKYVIIPYVNLKNMTATVNNMETDVKTALDTFMMVELKEGENTIKLSHTPQLAGICAIVTLCAIFIFVVFSLINKFFHISNNKFIVWFGFIGSCVLVLVVGFLVYLKPFFNFCVTLVS